MTLVSLATALTTTCAKAADSTLSSSLRINRASLTLSLSGRRSARSISMYPNPRALPERKKLRTPAVVDWFAMIVSLRRPLELERFRVYPKQLGDLRDQLRRRVHAVNRPAQRVTRHFQFTRQLSLGVYPILKHQYFQLPLVKHMVEDKRPHLVPPNIPIGVVEARRAGGQTTKARKFRVEAPAPHNNGRSRRRIRQFIPKFPIRDVWLSE